MSEKKRWIYIRLLQDLLKHENMSICHEAFFSEDVIRDILELLKAEPEQKKGKWVKDNYGNTVCSECLGIRRDNRINYINFCNQCGVDMRGEEDEN